MSKITPNKITPFLWFNNQAQEAAQFYTSLFPNSKIINSSPMSVSFEVAGLRLMAGNFGPEFMFNEAVSIFVDCDNQEEVDHYWNAFVENGGVAGQCGWLKDKWGVSWQIIPGRLGELMSDPDLSKSGKVIEAMMKMQKIIVADLEKAYNS